ncbi:MAG: DUF1493 family protein, partial [Proteobacteria bacterium]|nr:DUF1493 family protein [Pseudomonadota bacterium]
MGDCLDDRVRTVIADEIGIGLDKVRPFSDISHKLGVDGLDAENLLARVIKEFSIDMTGIQYERHFGPEGAFNPLALLTRRWWKWQRARIPVYPRHIAIAAKAQAWPIDYESGRLHISAPIADRVQEAIAMQFKPKDLSRESDLWSDLKIDGDDVGVLFTDLDAHFGPLPTSAIRFDQHFNLNEQPFAFDV